APVRRSKRPLQLSCASGPTPCSLAMTPFSPAGASNWSTWRRSTRSPRPTRCVNLSKSADIAKLVQFANRQGLKVAMRGQGHSFFGQTQVAGGVVVDSSSLNAIRIVKSGTGMTAEIGAGSKWHTVLISANAQKLTVPVITDTFLSVGGTISTGGFGV